MEMPAEAQAAIWAEKSGAAVPAYRPDLRTLLAAGLVRRLGPRYVRSMLTAYGEEHTRLRKLVAGAFTARRVADLQPRISEITDELLTRLEKVPPGHTVDLRREFAYELPIRVISELLGLEGRESHDFHRVVNVLFTTSTDPVQAQENQAELYALLGDLVGRKRAEPAADLTSALIATSTGP